MTKPRETILFAGEDFVPDENAGSEVVLRSASLIRPPAKSRGVQLVSKALNMTRSVAW